MSRRIDEQLWFRASAGLMATVVLGLMLNWLGPSLAGMPVVGAVIVQLCRVVNATCTDETAHSESPTFEPPLPPVPKVAEASEEKTDTHGSSLGDPIELEDLDDTDPLAGSLGPTDRERFYRFTLSSPSLFRLLIDGNVAHATLLDSSGNKLRAARRTSVGETLSQSLKADTYYVWVQATGNRQGKYHLSLAADALSSRADDDTLSTARDIGSLEESKFKDWVGNADAEDFYRFSLSEPGEVDLLLDGKAAHVLLLDARGEPVARGKNSGLVESISQLLEPGTYNVLVQQNSGREGAYQLNLSLQPRP